MQGDETQAGPILRLFQVQTKPGCADQLMKNFATTSAEVVKGEPGNKGYFFGRGVAIHEDYVVFVSVWRDLDAVKARFGEAWQESFLPPGYENLIDSCTLHHVAVDDGWQVDMADSPADNRSLDGDG